MGPDAHFCSKMSLKTGWEFWLFDPVCWYLSQRGTPYVKSAPKVTKSALKVTFFINKVHNFLLVWIDILAAQSKTNIRKIHKNNVETEAEAKAEAWAGRVHGGNNCSPLSDNCSVASTA